MAYDQNTRNRLQRFVSEARNLLSGEFTRQFQQKYGLDASSGEVSELKRMVHLNDREMETARMLRDTLAHYMASSPSGGKRECLERMIREQAFTVLNRLCALRMAEAREIIIESLSRTYNSKGFQLYARLAGTALGETGDAYRTYIFSLFDELSLDLPVLFDRFSPQGYLFPGEGVLLELLAMMNDSELSPLWVEDETIGWIYQYFNSLDERRQMRSESQAPRNSRELAVRNQFFTPRYVVEFLTDNTLGRLWYEMTRGETQLKDSCSYLVRRPQEIFLAAGEEAPETEASTDDLSQEEMLQQAVYIPYRPLKDPREILMLDPACGSMHFGLYAFDLYEKIYEEAWDLESQLGSQAFERSENLQPLQQTYASREEFLRDVPRLIVEGNIHGVDIDSRAVQIAGLSLWLRAQRSWQCQGVKPQQRPQIRKSNVVCAEPMPGEKGMLEEFAGKLKPRVLGQLVEMIFDKMQLAGEAGSLLKIEEEVEEALNLARKEFQKELQIRSEERNTLFPEIQSPRQANLFDFTDLVDKTRFWNFAEQKLLDALREYAEQAEGTEAVQKRLFAQDAARGFAFIDLFRKRYDVVLMNPPFGLGSKACQRYLDLNYIGSGSSEICASFYSRALDLLNDNNSFGAISSRTFYYLYSLTEWRCEEGFERSILDLCVDLGQGILDDALNETAAYVVRKGRNKKHICRFGMYHKYKNKIAALHDYISGENKVFFRTLLDFEILADKPLCYWVSSSFVTSLKSLKEFGDRFADVQMGLAPRDEFRFSRLWWEVPPQSVGKNKKWLPYAKGGELSPYYSDVELLILAQNDLKEIKASLNQKYPYLKGNLSWVLHPENRYFEPGLTFGQRTTFLRVSVLPEGCYFSVAGKGIFGKHISNACLLQLINTPTAQYLISLRRERLEIDPQFQEGDVYRMPWPEIPNDMIHILEELGYESGNLVRKVFIYDELDHSFIRISNPEDHSKLVKMVESTVELNEAKADILFRQLLALEEQDNSFIKDEIITKWHSRSVANWYSVKNVDQFQFFLGVIFGRWDIRYTTGEKEPPELSNLFEPHPICSPGMLQNKQGLPACTQDVPNDYPLRISWSGILVDDEGHTEDIIARVREAIEVIWKEKAGDIEQEACEILGVDSLRDYFRKPGNFFAEHLKRYSKSRRQAPIYWPLSTASGSYTIWLYYQRLSDQTLYRCVNDYIEPKLKQVMDSTRQLRQKTGRSRQEERDLEELVIMEQELLEFRDELLRVAASWKPDLNDGVQITAAPLWKLFRFPKWRTTLKETWGKLEKGDYDWAHLAYSIWPERVKEKCKHDKSLAIAHDLEDIYEEPVAQAKKKGGRGKKNT